MTFAGFPAIIVFSLSNLLFIKEQAPITELFGMIEPFKITERKPIQTLSPNLFAFTYIYNLPEKSKRVKIKL